MKKIIKEKIRKIFNESLDIKNYILNKQIDKIAQISEILVSCLKRGGKILIFGNGGSAADSQHMAAELVGRFQKERKAIAAIALTTDTSILTSLGNDYGFDRIFARQIEALGKKSDIAIGISTSGNSKNVIEGILQAKKKKIRTIGLVGHKGGQLSRIAELSIIVPSDKTARIQEAHITICHILCELIEDRLMK